MVRLDQSISRLDLQMANLDTKTTIVSSKISIERAYVDRHFNDMEPTLTGLMCPMNICEQITKN